LRRTASRLAVIAVAACSREGSTAVGAGPLGAGPHAPATSPLPRGTAPASIFPAPDAPTQDAGVVATDDAGAEGPGAFGFPGGYVVPAVWETRAVVVDGVPETWSLVWRKPPTSNSCTTSLMCPCQGVAWGLRGELDLVRDRPGQPVERLDLAAI